MTMKVKEYKEETHLLIVSLLIIYKENRVYILKMDSNILKKLLLECTPLYDDIINIIIEYVPQTIFEVGDIFDLLVKDRSVLYGNNISYNIKDEKNSSMDNSCIARYVVVKKNKKSIKIRDYSSVVRDWANYCFSNSYKNTKQYITRILRYNHCKNIPLKISDNIEYIEYIYKKLENESVIPGIPYHKYKQKEKKLYPYYKVGNIMKFFKKEIDIEEYPKRNLTRGFY